MFGQGQGCNLIIDNGSYDISRAHVYHLKVVPHYHPYNIGWIKKGLGIKVIDLCHVPIFIGKFCQNFIADDVVDIDKCHILLGGCGNMMLTLLTKVKIIYIHLEGQKSCHETCSTYSKFDLEKVAITRIPMQ